MTGSREPLVLFVLAFRETSMC